MKTEAEDSDSSDDLKIIELKGQVKEEEKKQ
jgi:hypothetical protein